MSELQKDFDGLQRLADARIVVEVAPQSRRSARPWLGLALCSLVLMSTWGLGGANRSNTADTPAALNDASFPGTIKPSQRSVVTSVAAGTVERVFVKVGDTVAAGQPLMEIEDPALRAAFDAARVDYESATAEAAHWQRSVAMLDQSLQQVSTALASSMGALALAQRETEQVPGRQFRDSPERAQALLDQETSKLQRLQKLHTASLVSDQQLEEQATAVRIALNDLENARRWREASQQLQQAQQHQVRQQVARSRAESDQLRAEYLGRLEQARGRGQQARQRLDIAEQKLSDAVVSASTAGVIVDVAVDVGSRPAPGTPLVTIAKLHDLLVDVAVSSKLVNVLRSGDAAMITLPTLPPAQVEGRIASINPIPAANMTHVVEVAFANTSGQLLSGQRAQVVFR